MLLTPLSCTSSPDSSCSCVPTTLRCPCTSTGASTTPSSAPTSSSLPSANGSSCGPVGGVSVLLPASQPEAKSPKTSAPRANARADIPHYCRKTTKCSTQTNSTFAQIVSHANGRVDI